MADAGFVHLRVHSAYSLSEGAIPVASLAELCLRHDMPAVAVTDTDNLFGALEVSENFTAKGIQPIIGCSLAVRPEAVGDLRRRHESSERVVLLVQNEVGYGNLLRLVSDAYLLSDMGDPPTTSIEALIRHNEGLIVLTGGADGPVGALLLQDRAGSAEALLCELLAAFSGRLYVEIQRHGMQEEARTENGLLDLAYKLNLPIVATNDAFFSDETMFEAHDALLCIASSSYVGQEERRRVTPQHYFKSADEMNVMFADLPEAIDNTVVIARRCAFRVPLRDPILPSFDLGELDEVEELRRQAQAGLAERLEVYVFTEGQSADERAGVAKPYLERLERELGIIESMDFPGYFLIVADFIRWAKANSIAVGPGRGSGAGSVVAWSLLITDLDPLRFGLLFERFLNPERVSMPDFDIDFCQEKRDKVIRYVQERYGRDQVAQIITFGKLQARAVLRDVGRVLEMPYGQVDRLCKMVPNNPANPVTLQQAIDGETGLQAERSDDESVARLLDIALKLEGLYRHASTHAAGVVIGDRPLSELVPMYQDSRSAMPATQFNMKWVELAGLVKFDFLGLKTLTVIEKACELIARRGDVVDPSNLPLEDSKTFKMLSKGETAGVFQLESSGMRDVLKKLKPDQFEDIIALVALYRPGPMDNIETYVKRKHGQEKADYMHERLQPVLEETYGVIIYQEQVMQIAQILAGYSLGEADLLRRAMGKKQVEEMRAQRNRFVEGAVERDVEKGQASFVFDLVDKFAGYGFNKSHAAAYAMVSYQTAWLKANYPVEFLAASLTLDMGNTDKVADFRKELSRMEIPLFPPDVNASNATFEVEDAEDGTLGIRYALAALKNVGAQSMEEVVRERQDGGLFADIFDFAERVDVQHVNKRQLESLIRAGAFDSLNPDRPALFRSVDLLLRHASSASRERASDQTNLFAGQAEAAPAPKLVAGQDWGRLERLNEELEAVGFYLSEHPLQAYGQALKQQNVLTYGEAEERARNAGGTAFRLAGTVDKVQERMSQRGNAYAFVRLSDQTGSYEVTFFSDVLSASRPLLEQNASVVVSVEARLEDDVVKLMAQSVRSVEEVTAEASAGLTVRIESEEPFAQIGGILQSCAPGQGYIHFLLDTDSPHRQVELQLSRQYAISPEIYDRVCRLPGVMEVIQT